MTKSRIALLLLIASLVAGFFIFDLGQYLTLDYIKSQQAQLDGLVAAHPLLSPRLTF